MKSFSKDDFTGMTINPFAKANGEFIWDNYSVFNRRVKFKDPGQWREGLHENHIPDHVKERYSMWDEQHLDLLIRYIIVFVDPESPLFDFADFDERIKEAKKCLKIPGKSDVGIRVNAEIDSDSDYYHLLLSEYFKMRNRTQYESWISMKLNYHYLSEFARKRPDKGDIRKEMSVRRALQKELEEMNYDIIKIEYDLFKDPNLGEILAKKATEDSVGGWVERMAEPKPWAKGDQKPQEEYNI